MNIEGISQNIPYLYWLLPRWKSFKKIEKEEEKDIVNPVEPVLNPLADRCVDYKESGKKYNGLGENIDYRA